MKQAPLEESGGSPFLDDPGCTLLAGQEAAQPDRRPSVGQLFSGIAAVVVGRFAQSVLCRLVPTKRRLLEFLVHCSLHTSLWKRRTGKSE
ncbi:hypothetical protein E2C01_073040 [Portunus trituberculatus]|uniref:Uncharacterized protein n=1 Tax=Portunus trituberculatus TaxID=210409 RepID=A0A5B7I462_PORTR|nr:hypothetical protein [Portunus trituberculatus]